VSVLRRIRIAHAIEHATVAVLHERLARRAPTIALRHPLGFSTLPPYTASAAAAPAAEASEGPRAGQHALAASAPLG